MADKCSSAVCTFNVATEEFGEVMVPEAVFSVRSHGSCTMSRYGDSLALVRHYDYNFVDPVNRGCDIWVMKQYGDAESWTYLFNIYLVHPSIYGFKRCGEVVLKECDQHGRRTMASFDPKTKQLMVLQELRIIVTTSWILL